MNRVNAKEGAAAGRCLLALVSLLLWATAGRWAMAAPSKEGQPPLKADSIIVLPGPSELRTSVWTDRARYREGERLNIHFFVSSPAYVYIYDLDTAGRVHLLFPNAYQIDNFVPAGTHSLPGQGYTFRVTGPAGAEYLQIVATQQPLRDLASSSAFRSSPFPQIGGSGPEVKHRVEGLLHAAGRGWAVAWTGFYVTTSQPSPPPAPAPPPPPAYQARGVIRIYSDPSGARVHVDGDYVGRTPTEVTVRPGWHRVRVELEEFPDRWEDVHVFAGDYEVVDVAWQPSERGLPSPPPPERPSVTGPPPQPLGGRIALSTGIGSPGVWSLGLEGGGNTLLFGGSVRFTAPPLPGAQGTPAEPTEVVMNGPEWELYAKAALPAVGPVALELSLGVARQPMAEVTKELRAGPIVANGVVPEGTWRPLPAEQSVTFGLGLRWDLDGLYLSGGWHSRRGLVVALGGQI